MGRIDINSSRDIEIKADCLMENVEFGNVRMIVLPGGRLGTENLAASEWVKEKCIEFGKHKMIAAVCAAPIILASLGLMNSGTVHPDYAGYMGGGKLLMNQ